MDFEILSEAATEVSDHMYGTKITTNTVLAAWLRRAGVSPVGAPWTVAKQVLGVHEDFRLAAEAAQRTAELDTRTRPSKEEPVKEADTKPSSGQRRRLGLSGTSWNPTRSFTRSGSNEEATPMETTTPKRGAMGKGASPVSQGPSALIQAPRRGARASGSLPEVVWHPKKGGIGDIEAEGLQNLLGRSALDRRQILVRETAQNSWDARLPNVQEVGFQFHLRRASSDDREVLGNLFRDRVPGLGLTSILGGQDVWLLEVSDRGTKGLGGPTRNDLAVSRDTPTDFIDFLLRVGAPRNSHMGGGTYGFGKSISYTATHSGTMLVWTKCSIDGRVESRFLGSAIGSSYDDGGFHYTGRHWWGAPNSNGTVEPLLDGAAEALGEALFTCPFKPNETGTSLLLIAPDFGAEGEAAAREYAESLVQGILWNLWPKLVPDAGRPAMNIRVYLNHEEVEIPNPETHPILKHFAASLKAVRSAQAGRSAITSPFTEPLVVKGGIRGRGANRMYGTAAITRFSAPPPNALVDTPFGAAEGVRHMCLMRHDAELVVKYLKATEDPEAEAAWAGVFKPSEENDDAFALSEPPTHDDWEPGAMSDPDAKSIVSIGLRRLNLAVDEHLKPAQSEERTSDTGVSVAGLSDALAGLVWGQIGSAPSQGGTGKSSQRRPRKPTASVGQVLRGAATDPGWQQIALLVDLKGPDSQTIRVTPKVRIGTAGEGESDESAFEVLGWDFAEPDFGSEPEWSDGDVLLKSDTAAWLRLKTQDGLAFDIDLEAGIDE